MELFGAEISFGEILDASFSIFFRYCFFAGAILIALISIARITSPRSLNFLADLKEKVQQKPFRKLFLAINILVGGVCGTIIGGSQSNLFVCIIAGAISGGCVSILIYSIIRFLHEYLQNEDERNRE